MNSPLIDSILNDEYAESNQFFGDESEFQGEQVVESEEETFPYNVAETDPYSDETYSDESDTDIGNEFYPDPGSKETEAFGFEEPETVDEYDALAENERVESGESAAELDEYVNAENAFDYFVQTGIPGTGESLYIDQEVYDSETEEDIFKQEFDVPSEKGITDYLNTSGVEKRALKTGVFIPAGYKKEDQVDMIVYFHGLYNHGNKINGMEYYWKNYSNIRERFAESNRNAILLAPALTSDPQQSIIVFGKANGFDNYVSGCFKELKSKNYLTEAAEPHRIILAGHSAGGSVLRRILGGKNDLLSKVIECWGFDCLYNYGWESLKTTIPFYHYWAFTGSGCISSPGKRGEQLQKSHGFQNIGPRQRVGHQWIIEYAWKNEINKRPWFDAILSKPLHELTEGESPEFRFNTTRLPLSDTPVVLVSGSARNRLAEIREAPSYFLRKIVEMALGMDAAAQWFNNFTRITFLGRELQPGQYVHEELARHLKRVEIELADKYGGPSKDPEVAGAFLLGDEKEKLAGSRPVSATATYSYHMFGLAIDVNYTGSPYIQNKERRGYSAITKKTFVKPNGVNTINEVLSNAGRLAGIPNVVFRYGLTYDQYDSLNKTLISYLTLMDAANENKLSDLLMNTPDSVWKGITIGEARNKIKADLDKLALSIDRWGYRELLKRKGFLNISREFVDGVQLAWGGSMYGDMMHFDMRNTGAGLKISHAISQYVVMKRREAASKYKG